MSETPTAPVRRVPLDEIDLGDRRFQIRLDPRAGQLKAALEREGQLVPVVLQKRRPRFRVVDGFRRCDALRGLGATAVDAMVLEVGDREALRLAYVLNSARKTLTPSDRWNSLRIMARRGWTNDRISRALGMHPTRVSKLRSLFPNMSEVDAGIAEGWLRPSHLRTLRTLLPRRAWPRWLRAIHDERLSGRALYDRIGAEERRREPPYLTKERGGVVLFRGFRFDPATAHPNEMWRALHQYDEGMDRIRSWLRRRSRRRPAVRSPGR